MYSAVYFKVSAALVLIQAVIYAKPLISIGLMCSGNVDHCGG